MATIAQVVCERFGIRELKAFKIDALEKGWIFVYVYMKTGVVKGYAFKLFKYCEQKKHCLSCNVLMISLRTTMKERCEYFL